MKDYYYILGINSSASDIEIKKAYRKLSTKFHPDKNKGDKFFENRFKEIQEAYETLSNKNKRIIYDSNYRSQNHQRSSEKSKREGEIISFDVSKTNISNDEEVTFFWATKNISKVKLSCFSNYLPPSGKKTVKINAKESKVLSIKLTAFENNGSSVTESISISFRRRANKFQKDEEFKYGTQKEESPKGLNLKPLLWVLLPIIICTVLFAYFNESSNEPKDINSKSLSSNTVIANDNKVGQNKSDREILIKFIDNLNDGSYDEAYRLSSNSLWKDISYFKNVAWANLTNFVIRSQPEYKYYESKWKAEKILNLKFNAYDNKENKLRELEFDFHMSRTDSGWKIIRMIYPKQTEKHNSHTIDEFIENYKRELSSVGFYHKDLEKYNSRKIDKVKVIKITFTSKNREEYLLLCEIMPESLEEDYSDAHIGSNQIVWVTNRSGYYQVEEKIDGFLNPFYTRFSDSFKTSDLNNNGIEEIHIQSSTSTTSPGVSRYVYVLECNNGKINNLWVNGGFRKAELKEDYKYVFYNWYWANGIGRYAPSNWDVRLFQYKNNTFTMIDSVRTKEKFDGWDTDFSAVYKDAYGKSSSIKNETLNHLNNLHHGISPYKYCYGNENSCDYSCSKISVKASNNSDVIALIKKNGTVFRNAFISKGRTFEFNLPNGTYQPFFYYGNNWDNTKYMKVTSCGSLYGGFLENEHFGKDNPQRLNNNILSYELVLQRNGNFSTESSSVNEAF